MLESWFSILPILLVLGWGFKHIPIVVKNLVFGVCYNARVANIVSSASPLSSVVLPSKCLRLPFHCSVPPLSSAQLCPPSCLLFRFHPACLLVLFSACLVM